MLSVRVNVPPLSTPPPLALGLPCRMVTPEMATSPPVMLKTRKSATPGALGSAAAKRIQEEVEAAGMLVIKREAPHVVAEEEPHRAGDTAPSRD